MNTSWHVYIVRCVDGSLYTGITNKLEERIRRHNQGQGGAYTRSHRPVVFVWKEEVESGSAARKREAQIKSWKKEKKEELIKRHTG